MNLQLDDYAELCDHISHHKFQPLTQQSELQLGSTISQQSNNIQ